MIFDLSTEIDEHFVFMGSKNRGGNFCITINGWRQVPYLDRENDIKEELKKRIDEIFDFIINDRKFRNRKVMIVDGPTSLISKDGSSFENELEKRKDSNGNENLYIRYVKSVEFVHRI